MRKWQGYRLGRHTPSPSLVEKIDNQLPGSANLLNHPVWQALRVDNNAKQQASILLSQLHPDVATALTQNVRNRRECCLAVDGWNRRRLRKLEQQVSLDALATLVLLLRLAVKTGKQDQAFAFGFSVCRILLMMGPWLTARGIARPLSEYLMEHVLPLGHHNGEYHCFGHDFVGAARQLSRTAWLIEGNENKPFTAQERAALLLDLLDDKFSVQLSDLVVTRPTRSLTDATLKNSRTQVN